VSISKTVLLPLQRFFFSFYFAIVRQQGAFLFDTKITFKITDSWPIQWGFGFSF